MIAFSANALANCATEACWYAILQEKIWKFERHFPSSQESYQAVNPAFPSLRYGLVVKIAGPHPAGPGSIPGNGIPFCISPKIKKTVTVWMIF